MTGRRQGMPRAVRYPPHDTPPPETAQAAMEEIQQQAEEDVDHYGKHAAPDND